jgi:hypothetical protein
MKFTIGDGQSGAREWCSYPVPLQDSGAPVLATLRVPTDLTRAEAQRIHEMVEALVLTVEQESEPPSRGRS